MKSEKEIQEQYNKACDKIKEYKAEIIQMNEEKQDEFSSMMSRLFRDKMLLGWVLEKELN